MGRTDLGAAVLGVDPGLNATGYAVLLMGRRPCLVEGGLIRTSPRLALEQRLLEIYDQLLQVAREFRPGLMVVEDLFTDYRRPATAVLMGHARGACLLAAAGAGLRVASYPPARVKKAITGSGSASKEQVRRMVASQLEMGRPIASEHVADAIAVALCHLDETGRSWPGREEGG